MSFTLPAVSERFFFASASSAFLIDSRFLSSVSLRCLNWRHNSAKRRMSPWSIKIRIESKLMSAFNSMRPVALRYIQNIKAPKHIDAHKKSVNWTEFMDLFLIDSSFNFGLTKCTVSKPWLHSPERTIALSDTCVATAADADLRWPGGNANW